MSKEMMERASGRPADTDMSSVPRAYSSNDERTEPLKQGSMLVNLEAAGRRTGCLTVATRWAALKVLQCHIVSTI